MEQVLGTKNNVEEPGETQVDYAEEDSHHNGNRDYHNRES